MKEADKSLALQRKQAERLKKIIYFNSSLSEALENLSGLLVA
jgi:hypothetical protein